MAIDYAAHARRDDGRPSRDETEADRLIEDLARTYVELSIAMQACKGPVNEADLSAAQLAEIEEARDQFFDHMTSIAEELQSLRATSISAMKCKAAVLKDWYVGDSGTVQDSLVRSIILDIEALNAA